MSRIGKMPVKVLDGVSVNIDSNNLVTVTGPLGTLSQIVDKNIKVTVVLPKPSSISVTSYYMKNANNEYNERRDNEWTDFLIGFSPF